MSRWPNKLRSPMVVSLERGIRQCAITAAQNFQTKLGNPRWFSSSCGDLFTFGNFGYRSGYRFASLGASLRIEKTYHSPYYVAISYNLLLAKFSFLCPLQKEMGWRKKVQSFKHKSSNLPCPRVMCMYRYVDMSLPVCL